MRREKERAREKRKELNISNLLSLEADRETQKKEKKEKKNLRWKAEPVPAQVGRIRGGGRGT